MTIHYTTTIKSFGNHAAIEVSEEDVLSFGVGKRVPVKVSLNGYSYQSTITVMDGMYLIPFATEHRLKSGVMGGETVKVTLELESKNRDIEIPQRLKERLIENNLLDLFEGKSYSTRKEYIRQLNESKKEETTLKRLAKIIEELNGISNLRSLK